MARAEACAASVRSDSIKGLAQSIAKPAYRRLSDRRAGAAPRGACADHRLSCHHLRRRLRPGARSSSPDALADAVKRHRRRRRTARGASRATPREQATASHAWRRLQSELDHAAASIPGRRAVAGRTALHRHRRPITAGCIIATGADRIGDIRAARKLIDVLGAAQPLTTLGAGGRRHGNRRCPTARARSHGAQPRRAARPDRHRSSRAAMRWPRGGRTPR